MAMAIPNDPPPLSCDALLSINSGAASCTPDGGSFHPSLQVLAVKQIATAQMAHDRYRLLLSDGTFIQQAMLATQLNDLVTGAYVQNGTIVRLTEYICNTVQNRKIIIVLGMEVVVPMSDIIGDPKQTITHDESLSAALQQHTPVMLLETRQDGPLSAKCSPPPVLRSALNVSNQGQNSSDKLFANAPASSSRKPDAATNFDRGFNSNNGSLARVVPISHLSPYLSFGWAIKARVTAKSEVRHYNNEKGSGKWFSFDLLDADEGEIRVTCFNSSTDLYYDRIRLGKVYLISKAIMKPAWKFNNNANSKWDLHLDHFSVVEPCEEEISIPPQKFSFRPISEIENLEQDTMVDVLGVVVTVTPSVTVMRKNGTVIARRSLQLQDMSGCSVEVTMWAAFCNREGQCLQELCDSGKSPVLAIKGGKVSEFHGKYISTLPLSQLLINPNFPQAYKMEEWYEQGGKITKPKSISREGRSSLDVRKTVSQIKDEGLGRSEKPNYIFLKGTITYVKTDNFCYTGCALPFGDRQCCKKVVNNGDGTWRCDRCDKSVAECDYRYLLSLQVQDHTGVTWLTGFQEAGEELFGVAAKELYRWKQDENPKSTALFQKLIFSQYLFKLKVNEENYNDEQHVKATIINTEHLDYVAESRVLLNMIGRLLTGHETSGPPSVIAGESNLGFNGSHGFACRGTQLRSTAGRGYGAGALLNGVGACCGCSQMGLPMGGACLKGGPFVFGGNGRFCQMGSEGGGCSGGSQMGGNNIGNLHICDGGAFAKNHCGSSHMGAKYIWNSQMGVGSFGKIIYPGITHTAFRELYGNHPSNNCCHHMSCFKCGYPMECFNDTSTSQETVRYNGGCSNNTSMSQETIRYGGSCHPRAPIDRGQNTCLSCEMNENLVRDCHGSCCQGDLSQFSALGDCSGGKMANTSAGFCFKCGQIGHWAKDCRAHGLRGCFSQNSTLGSCNR